MNITRKVIVSAAIAAVFAVALLVGALSMGAFGLGQSSTNTTHAQSGTGTLSVALTDPPTVPSGVTAVYITYNDLQVHVAAAGNNSGWYDLNSAGQINLMSVINVSQVVASAKVQSGYFNWLRFNITAATVTYNGQNYSASLIYERHTLVVPIEGGIHVTAAQSTTALIDLTPTVLLLNGPSNPGFVFVPSAHGYVVPSQSVPANSIRVGERHDLSHDNWWQAIRTHSEFAITGVHLSGNSLSVSVENTGNASVVFSVAAISSQYSDSGGYASALSLSQVFIVEPNATLVAVNGGTRGQILGNIASGGYLLAPKQSVTFTYSGPIALGGLIHSQVQQIIGGQHYVVSLEGNAKLAQAGATASSSGSTTTSTTTTTSSNTSSSSSQ